MNGMDIVAATDEEILTGMPCDQLGVHYIFGISVYHPRIVEFSRIPLGEGWRNGYYPFFREYLSSIAVGQHNRSDIENEFGVLVAGAASHVLSPNGDIEREKIYSAFLLGEFWTQFGITDGFVADQMSSTIESLMLGIDIDSYDEIFCFVFADFPTLSIENILNSDRFNSCYFDRSVNLDDN